MLSAKFSDHKRRQLISYIKSKIYDKEMLENSFYSFVKVFWADSSVFKGNFHLEAICEHLEYTYSGDIQKLMILAPPRSTKSWLLSLFAAWVWCKSPQEQFICASHTFPLAVRNSNRVRKIILSPEYLSLWGHKVTLDETQYAKVRFENTKGGTYQPTGVNSEPTGYGGTYQLIDDPSGAVKISNSTQRAKARDWYFKGFISRVNNMKARTIMAMQRLHPLDLAFMIMSRDAGFEVLCFPLVFDGIQRSYTSLSYKDPREVDEVLDPIRYSTNFIEIIKTNESNIWDAQYQQSPNKDVDFYFDVGDILFSDQKMRKPNLVSSRYIFADTAFKDKEDNDFTALLVIELTIFGKLNIIDGYCKRIRFQELLKVIESYVVKHSGDGKLEDVVIEDKGSGTCAIDYFVEAGDPSVFDKVNLVAYAPKGSKEKRADLYSIWVKRHFVYLSNQTSGQWWRQQFIKQLSKFPDASVHDDFVDCLSSALDYLTMYLRDSWLSSKGVIHD